MNLSSALTLTLVPLALAAARAGNTAPPDAHELGFLTGRWDLEVSHDTDGRLASGSTLALDCTEVDGGLDCHLTAATPAKAAHGSQLHMTIRPSGDAYDVSLRKAEETVQGSGQLRRPDTFVVEADLAAGPVRLWCLAVPPGRRMQIWVETRPDAGEPSLLFEATGRLDRESPQPPPGRTRGERSIVMHAVVDAPVGAVYGAFLDTEKADRFFGLGSRIDGRVGERYEIDFLPLGHPAGRKNSSSGARLLARDDGRFLSFEWTAPPMVGHLNTDPLPTWVELTFSEAPGSRAATSILLEHHGFLRGEDWDFNFEFFERGWSNILWRLQQAARLDLLR